MDLDASVKTPLLEIVGRLLLAALLGGLVGWERESQGKPAGLRTHMMVSMGAAGFTIVCMDLYVAIVATSGGRQISADPLRILEAVVGGLGFLGAGTIIQARGNVQGITTAAALWLAGGIGLACGVGHYVLAGAMVVPAVLILAVVGRIERRIVPRADGPDREPVE